MTDWGYCPPALMVAQISLMYRQRVAVSLDARGDADGELTSRGWTVGTGLGVLEAVARFEDAGASAFVYTDVGRDGTMAGPNLAGIERVARSARRPVIASGGISTLDELRTVARLHSVGVRGAVVGRALYEHRFSVGDAIRAADAAAARRWEPPPGRLGRR